MLHRYYVAVLRIWATEFFPEKGKVPSLVTIVCVTHVFSNFEYAELCFSWVVKFL